MNDKELMKGVMKEIWEAIDNCEHNYGSSVQFEKDLKQDGRPSEVCVLATLNRLVWTQLATLYKGLGGTIRILIDVKDSLENTPDRNELENIEKELSKKVTDTLTPISDALKKTNKESKDLGYIG